MPQYLKKITPEYAKSFYGFVVDPALPFSGGQPPRFNVTKKEDDNSRSTTITRNPEYENQEYDEQPPSNGSLF